MTPQLIGLVLFSTVMHASWNLLARRERCEGLFLSRMLVIISIAGFLPVLVSEIMVRSLTPLAWACVVGSGLCCGVYYYFLAKSYESSDFTVVYPVVRSLPVLLIAFGDVLRGKFLTGPGWVGMVIVAMGCFLAPLHSIREISLSKYLNRTTLWLVMAALGTVGYSLLDKAAAEVVKQGPATAARYAYVFFLVSYLTYESVIRLRKDPRQRSETLGWIMPALGSVFCFGAYWLVLWVYQMADNASYVYAFRQFSILIGVALGFVIYKERGVRVRMAAAAMIIAGLVVIGLWGR